MLYSHFSESLSGLATIRAYGETDRFLDENKKRVDVENRAYWLTVTNQRWLGIRLDLMGILLTLAVSLLTVGTRYPILPSQTGLVFLYIISVQQVFGWSVHPSAEVENDFYAHELEEAPHELRDRKPKAPCPVNGQVQAGAAPCFEGPVLVGEARWDNCHCWSVSCFLRWWLSFIAG